jgi:ribosomal protein S18 acetylase RimI-like enzyme
VTRFRRFRNTDPPALAKIWNQSFSGPGVVRPVRVHELDSHAFGMVNFDPSGLIVAEIDGRVVGFVHAGFGPDFPVEPSLPFQLCHELGTIAMLAIEPNLEDHDLIAGLLSAAEDYLRAQGAKVVYAGALFPLNPFYWGLAGGSEGAGILSGHHEFHRSLVKRGYKPAGTTVLLEADLTVPERRDPRGVLIRRQTDVAFVEDAVPANWWQNQAIGDFQILTASLSSKATGAAIARATAWDMGWFGRGDSRSRIGLVDVEVPEEHRRKGYGRFLISEIFRRARDNMVALAAVGASAANQPALALYASLGFQPVEEATLYRLTGV